LNRESRDHIKGRAGICIHAVGSSQEPVARA